MENAKIDGTLQEEWRNVNSTTINKFIEFQVKISDNKGSKGGYMGPIDQGLITLMTGPDAARLDKKEQPKKDQKTAKKKGDEKKEQSSEPPIK